MRRLIGGLVLTALALLALAWWFGAFQALTHWAAGQQRLAQSALARSLRALRVGEPGAIIGFAAVCFSYGFLHAIGPGHGKLAVGGYGLARKVTALRLGAIAISGSLVQALTAILLVYSGITILQISRTQITDIGEDWFAPASAAAIVAIGVWLVIRGVNRIRKMTTHNIDGHGHCHTCGHAHGPDPEAVANSAGWRESLALVIGVGIRPCTGALFVLILGWRMEIEQAAIMGAIAMAIGTACVTLVIALGAVGLRSGALASLGESGRANRIAAMVEVLAGLVVVVLAVGLFMQAV